MTTLFGNAAIENAAAIEASAPKKRGWLPLLTVLFLISYGLMTLLIVEQGSTIESQRALIRELFRDSSELSAMKMKQAAVAGQAKNQTQNPSTQNPSTQAPTKKAPSSQAVPQGRAQNQQQARPQSTAPEQPASDLVDRRRALITI